MLNAGCTIKWRQLCPSGIVGTCFIDFATDRTLAEATIDVAVIRFTLCPDCYFLHAIFYQITSILSSVFYNYFYPHHRKGNYHVEIIG